MTPPVSASLAGHRGRPCATVSLMTKPKVRIAPRGRPPASQTNNPLAVRFPQDVRTWLIQERERTAQPINALVVQAVNQLMRRRASAQKRHAAPEE